eukprot:1246877-Rhodomonas_salina.1
MHSKSCLYNAISSSSVRGMWTAWSDTDIRCIFHLRMRPVGHHLQVPTCSFQILSSLIITTTSTEHTSPSHLLAPTTVLPVASQSLSLAIFSRSSLSSLAQCTSTDVLDGVKLSCNPEALAVSKVRLRAALHLLKVLLSATAECKPQPWGSLKNERWCQ